MFFIMVHHLPLGRSLEPPDEELSLFASAIQLNHSYTDSL
ncbi:hypothetical protein Sps_02303 [Shewanella psychrophila]|uniref:Uncharacterized protein n=1 Tax=Shewanella psychrophila TaxID=225848 RepID=A0A1S6HPK9_9GAMM|nr:hypothetical protein Sps_02302 [Shewanella psychrophila]AQS37461.1 hypothetical protein Sps_02303 [Shewanella psychrophila]